MPSSVSRAGYWSGLSAFTATLAFVVVQVAQVAGALHFPLDEILIYGTSLAIVVPFVLEMVAFHHPTYSQTLLFLGFPWGLTAPLSMLLLAIALRRRSLEA